MKKDKTGLVIGGAALIGLGVGFIFLERSGLYFVASIVIGTGVGLLAAYVLRK